MFRLCNRVHRTGTLIGTVLLIPGVCTYKVVEDVSFGVGYVRPGEKQGHESCKTKKEKTKK